MLSEIARREAGRQEIAGLLQRFAGRACETGKPLHKRGQLRVWHACCNVFRKPDLTNAA